jgi:exonuclease III
VNAHAPDPGKTAAVRDAFQEKLQIALEKSKRQDDALVTLGDFNAPQHRWALKSMQTTGSVDRTVFNVKMRWGGN